MARTRKNRFAGVQTVDTQPNNRFAGVQTLDLSAAANIANQPFQPDANPASTTDIGVRQTVNRVRKGSRPATIGKRKAKRRTTFTEDVNAFADQLGLAPINPEDALVQNRVGGLPKALLDNLGTGLLRFPFTFGASALDAVLGNKPDAVEGDAKANLDTRIGDLAKLLANAPVDIVNELAKAAGFEITNAAGTAPVDITNLTFGNSPINIRKAAGSEASQSRRHIFQDPSGVALLLAGGLEAAKSAGRSPVADFARAKVGDLVKKAPKEVTKAPVKPKVRPKPVQSIIEATTRARNVSPTLNPFEKVKTVSRETPKQVEEVKFNPNPVKVETPKAPEQTTAPVVAKETPKGKAAKPVLKTRKQFEARARQQIDEPKDFPNAKHKTAEELLFIRNVFAESGMKGDASFAIYKHGGLKDISGSGVIDELVFTKQKKFSTTPPFWKNKGYRPFEMMKIAQKALEGKRPLTENQKTLLDAAMEDFNDFMIRENRPSGLDGIREINRQLREASVLETAPRTGGTPVPVQQIPEVIALKKKAAKSIRDDLNFDQLDKVKRQTHEKVLDDAIEQGYDVNALETANEVLVTRRSLSAREHAGMVVKAARVIDEIDETLAEHSKLLDEGDVAAADAVFSQFDVLKNELDILTRASDRAGTEAGRALSIRRLAINRFDFSIAKVIQRAEAVRGEKLPEAKVAELQKITAKYHEAVKALEKEQKRADALELENERIVAERVLRQRTRRRKITQIAESRRVKIRQDRADVLAQLKAIGFRVNDVTGVTAEGAYLVGKLAMTYVDEGAVTLAEVAQKVISDLPELTEKDVIGIMAKRERKLQDKAKLDVIKRRRRMKRQAQLLVEVNDAFEGNFGPARVKSPASGNIKAFNFVLRKLRAEAGKTITSPKKLERLNKLIDSARAQFEGKFRNIREETLAETDPRVLKAQKILKGITDAIKEEDRLSILKDKVRLAGEGIFEPIKKKAPVPKQIRDLQRLYAKLRREAYNSPLNGDALERAIKTINELQDQLDNNYRRIKQKKPVVPEQLQSMRDKANAIRSEMRVVDEIARLDEQLRTGQFEVRKQVKPKVIPESLERKQIELTRKRREVLNAIEASRRIKGKTFGGTVKNVGRETVDFLRTAKATADMSATLRQGLLAYISLLSRKPSVVPKIFLQSAKSFFSKYTEAQIHNAIINSPEHFFRERAGLQLTDVGGKFSSREEFFQSRWAESIKGYKTIVDASERHMVSTLNMLRVNLFDWFREKHPNATREELAGWADYVNKATGRGDLRSFRGAASVLGTVFFAPKLSVSRFQVPLALFKQWDKPRVRRAIARDYATFGVAAATTLTLAQMGGAEVSLNPESSDFLKVKIGNTRFDYFAGFQQPMRLVLRIGKFGTDRIGLTQKPKTSFFDASPLEILSRFTAFKVSPIISTSGELLTGKNAVGDKVSPTESLTGIVTPLVFGDIKDTYSKAGFGRAALVAPQVFFGAGANTFNRKKKIRRGER